MRSWLWPYQILITASHAPFLCANQPVTSWFLNNGINLPFLVLLYITIPPHLMQLSPPTTILPHNWPRPPLSLVRWNRRVQLRTCTDERLWQFPHASRHTRSWEGRTPPEKDHIPKSQEFYYTSELLPHVGINRGKWKAWVQGIKVKSLGSRLYLVRRASGKWVHFKEIGVLVCNILIRVYTRISLR